LTRNDVNVTRGRVDENRRLDAIVAESTGLTRSQARAVILAGKVRVDDEPSTKPGTTVRLGATVIVEEPPRYVSRGGDKMAGALASFALDPTGMDVLDVGASTGGFTDALLQAGAKHVTALDVGYGQIAWRIRTDERVTVIERTNFRTVKDDAFPDGFDLVVIDASFISLRALLATAAAQLRPGATIVALVKPQFEAGRERLGSGGVVRDAATHRAVLGEVREVARHASLVVIDAALSPLKGPSGNVEFFYRIARAGDEVGDDRLDALVAEAHAE